MVCITSFLKKWPILRKLFNLKRAATFEVFPEFGRTPHWTRALSGVVFKMASAESRNNK
jgi:hypothetical protein